MRISIIACNSFNLKHFELIRAQREHLVWEIPALTALAGRESARAHVSHQVVVEREVGWDELVKVQGGLRVGQPVEKRVVCLCCVILVKEQAQNTNAWDANSVSHEFFLKKFKRIIFITAWNICISISNDFPAIVCSEG
jgi:hypothetical protein